MKIFTTLLLAVIMTTPTSWSEARSRQVVPFVTASAAQTRDSWRSVRTNNLFVIGNTDPENLRQVAVWLEFFHSAFARLVSRSVLNASVPTTVVVFRDEASFLPFKPLYQGKPANVAGYFQPGEDVNYIAISLERSERDPYATAFHEYVHLHLRDNIPGVPLWLNEGLAEFYGSLQFSSGEAVLGAPIAAYLRLLRSQEMLPLATLFSISTNSPHYNEADKTGIFYGQSWALVHYLMLGGGGRRQDQFKHFLQLVSRGESTDKALEQAYGMSLTAVEKGFQDYVNHGEVTGQRIPLGEGTQSYLSYTATQRSSLTESEANYYLGDLLLHTNRENDAERYFKQSLALDPGFAPANASMGLLCVYRRRYAEAKTYLQKATASPQSYLIHYLYAYVLSREGVTSTSQHGGYSPENILVMRDQLRRSIKLAPEFAASHYLLALVDLVADDQLDEAQAMAEKARQLAPSKAAYAMLLAQIYWRRSNVDEARRVLEPLTRDTDPTVRSEAQNLLSSVDQTSGSAVSARSTRGPVKLSNTMIAEPVQPEISRGILGGTGSVGAVRDGQTIETSGPMPALAELLDRYIQALGGAAAINAVTSRVTKGTVDVVGVSRNGSLEVYAQAPNKTLTIIQAHPMGTVKLGFNGRIGWEQSVAGLRAVKGVELGALQRDSDFYEPLRLKNNYARIIFVGKSKIGYREVYVVDLQPASGANERLFLDAETYLPVRLNTFRTSGRQSAPVEIYLDDWRAIDGIKYPFSINQSFPGLTLAITVKEIKHNVTINPTLFETPTK